jgi:hypothetical protein
LICQGTHKVGGIILDLSEKGDLHVQADTFYMMTKLKFLRLYLPLSKKRSATIHHPEDMMPFSNKLRYLEWNACSLKSLPEPFFAELLVEIHLPHSNVKYLWQGVQVGVCVCICESIKLKSIGVCVCVCVCVCVSARVCVHL